MWRALKVWCTVQRIKRMRRRMSSEWWELTWGMYEESRRDYGTPEITDPTTAY